MVEDLTVSVAPKSCATTPASEDRMPRPPTSLVTLALAAPPAVTEPDDGEIVTTAHALGTGHTPIAATTSATTTITRRNI